MHGCQFFSAVIILLMVVFDIGAGPLLVLNSVLISIFCLTLFLVRVQLFALEDIWRYVAIGNLAQIINTLIKVEKSFVGIVDTFGVLLFIPLFDSPPLLVLTVLFLDNGDVSVRILLNLHHVHSF